MGDREKREQSGRPKEWISSSDAGWQEGATISLAEVEEYSISTYVVVRENKGLGLGYVGPWVKTRKPGGDSTSRLRPFF